MKNAVVSIAIGDYYKKIAKISHPRFQEYAQKIKAEFVPIFKNIIKNSPSAHWNKLFFNDLLLEYDRLIYFDTDILIRDDCPNLFDIIPENRIAMFNEAPYVNRYSAFIETCNAYKKYFKDWEGEYYNTGVIVMSKEHRKIFKTPDFFVENFYEQSYINMMLWDEEVKVFNLDYKFNRMSCIDKFIGEDRHASYCIHYAGIPDPGSLSGLMYQDLKVWEKSKPDYKYPYHILMDIQGGLGDQICAEPVARYAINNLYDKDDDIVIATHFPEIFKHLNVQVIKHDEKDLLSGDKVYYHMLSLPGPDKILWSFISPTLSFTTDYISIAMLHRVLLENDKKIVLTYSKENLENIKKITPCNFENLILVHPNKSWESKTFPVEWWQNIIDELSKEYTVGIIGKNIDENMTLLPVKTNENCIDYRNILSLDELFALIGNAKLLITGDSSPIHISGAFDNFVIFIATCKYPEHTMPIRNKDKIYPMFKKLVIDQTKNIPNIINTQTIDKIHGNILDYIPNASDVITQAKKIMLNDDESPCLT
jgi:lipopolysaccharide biosynthesis glycosyltransferase